MQEYAFQLRHFKDTWSNMAQFLVQRMGVNNQSFSEVFKPSLMLQELSNKAKYYDYASFDIFKGEQVDLCTTDSSVSDSHLCYCRLQCQFWQQFWWWVSDDNRWWGAIAGMEIQLSPVTLAHDSSNSNVLGLCTMTNRKYICDSGLWIMC